MELSETVEPRHRADEILLGFTRALRVAGVPVTQDRAHSFLDATALVGADSERGTYLAGRATLCAGPDDLERFDQVFTAWFDVDGLPRSTPHLGERQQSQILPQDDGDGDGLDGDPDDADLVRARASAVEVLRHRDVAALDAAAKRRLDAMFATLRPRMPRRRTARHQRWHRGDLDAHGTLRESLRRMGEPGPVLHRRRATRPRRVVLLVDVSGSMTAYADALLRLAHRMTTAAPPGTVEVFTVGTRLTHITKALRLRDPDRAIVAAGETVPDWSGGTRLGDNLKMFLDRWGARGMARGAVVVLFSDGWERGEPDLLAHQMARLQRVARRVVWVNPHRGKRGYEPVQQGVLAALPHCDDFLAGHSLATFSDLLEVIADA